MTDAQKEQEAFAVATGIFTAAIGPAESVSNELAAITNMDDGKRAKLYAELSIESMAFGYAYIGNKLKYAEKDQEAVKKAIEDEIFPRFAMRDEALASAGRKLFSQRVTAYSKSHNLPDTFKESILQIFQDAELIVKAELADKYLHAVANGLEEVQLET